MKKGVNYTRALEDLHSERFFAIEVRRVQPIIFVCSLTMLLLVIVGMFVSYNFIFLGISTLILMTEVIIIGLDIEDMPLYVFFYLWMTGHAKRRVAGGSVCTKKPYERQIQLVRMKDRAQE